MAVAAALLATAPAGLAGQTPAAAGAGDRPAPVRLSLEEAVRRAVALNEEVLMARADRARTEGLVREVRARSLPEITANFGYTRNIQRPVLFFNTPEGVQQISIGNDNDYAVGLSFRQALLDFSIGPARAAARLSEDATAAQVEGARTRAALEARTAYYRTLLDRALLRVQEQALEQARARLEEVELQHRAGTASEFDLLTAQVEVDNIRPRLIEARNRYRLQTDRLRRIVNLPLETPVELTDSLGRTEYTVPEDPAAYALENRADLASQRTRVALERQNLTAQENEALPAFELVASLSRRGSSDEFFPGEEDFSQSATAGLNVSLPLFDGRQRAGRVQQARATVDREGYRLEQLADDVRLEVQGGLQAVEATAERIEASESNVRRAERALEIAQTRFRNGLSTQVELNDAELAATEARTNYAQALFDFNVALAGLRAALGDR